MIDAAVCILALGASTPVGRDAWSSAAAVRAGISGFAEHPFMLDTAGEPMRAAFAPWLDIDLGGVERFEALLLPALEQVLESARDIDGKRLRLGLSIGLPSARPGLADDLALSIVQAVGRQFRHDFSAVATFDSGHAAGIAALDAAAGKVRSGAFDACVVAGVDSYLEPETLEWLEDNEQLHSAGPLNNAWGFVPGEGAGAILVASAETARRLGLVPLAAVLGIGSGFETKQIKTRTVCIAEGLTQAFRATLTHLPPGWQVTDIYCDMNGEPYRADEFGFAALRTKESFETVSDFVAPADCWGDVGAASGPLHLLLASAAGAKDYARGRLAFVWASAERGERAAALVATKGKDV